MKKTTVAIYLYNRLFDPLIQSNFWLYIKDYLNDPSSTVRFHLITYEDPNYPLTAEQQALVNGWQAQGLDWTALTWHPGMSLKQKFADLFNGLRLLARLRLKGIKHVVTLGSVAGTFGYVCARALFMKLFLYQFEPHSELSRDAGAWRADSLQFKLSYWLERRATEFATVIASGTRFMRERLKDQWGVKGRFIQIPTVANDRKFTFDAKVRADVRAELGLGEADKVLFYSGKFGGLYYGVETAQLFRWLLDMDPSLRMLIVTPHTDDEVHELFDQAAVPRDRYFVRHSSYDDIHRYYFAGDIGLITIPPGPSQFFRSSIKVGEYLCSGMPFITPWGVSEDYLYATEKNVGVVVQEFSESEVKSAWPRIKQYLDMDPDTLRAHCRTVGVDYRGFDALNPRFKAAIEHLTKD